MSVWEIVVALIVTSWAAQAVFVLVRYRQIGQEEEGSRPGRISPL